jgi:hypothetical protein
LASSEPYRPGRPQGHTKAISSPSILPRTVFSQPSCFPLLPVHLFHIDNQVCGIAYASVSQGISVLSVLSILSLLLAHSGICQSPGSTYNTHASTETGRNLDLADILLASGPTTSQAACQLWRTERVPESHRGARRASKHSGLLAAKIIIWVWGRAGRDLKRDLSTSSSRSDLFVENIHQARKALRKPERK